MELELSFKTTLANYSMGYSSESFAISNDVIYVANGANVGKSYKVHHEFIPIVTQGLLIV